MPRIFNALGIEATLLNGALEDNMHQVASGEIDGLAAFAGIPMEGLAELDAQVPLDYLQPSPAQIALVRKEFPEISPSFVPAGTYPSLTTDYHALWICVFTVADEDLPDDLVYKIVITVFEHHQELVEAHPAAKETLPPNVGRDTFLPFHPGAVRYYQESSRRSTASNDGAGGLFVPVADLTASSRALLAAHPIHEAPP